MPKQNQTMRTNKHGLAIFIHVPSEGKHPSAMLFKNFFIYARRLYEDFAANTKCHTIKIVEVETPGEGSCKSNRL